MRFSKVTRGFLLPLLLLVVALSTGSVFAALKGAVYTTDMTATVVNENVHYALDTDVYLSGGPQNKRAAGLPDGTYYFQVTDPSGKVLLSTDDAVCRQLMVVGGRVAGATGPCPHFNGAFNPANGTTPVQLAPFSATPNPGGVYKAWLIAQGGNTSISVADPKVINFRRSNSSTDNYKVLEQDVFVPEGACQPSSSLSVLVTGTDVVSYIPKGAWGSATPGVSVINIEGTSIVPTVILTPGAVNSCASNPVTGETVCVENGTAVHVISGTALVTPAAGIPSDGVGTVFFSGGSCTNCGVMMDSLNNKAAISMATAAGVGGFQYLDLSGSPVFAFEPPFASMAPNLGGFANISENPLIDPTRNLIYSADENNNFEIIDVTNTLAPLFFENPIVVPSGGLLDSTAADCATGIILALAEFLGPSEVYIADISNPTFAPFVVGAPGTWSAPSQVQTLSGSFLSAGASGIAVAQGTSTGVVSGEFGGDAITLPATSGLGAVPAIQDWVTCRIPGNWSHGLDPHTLTAYQSPNSGNAIALFANLPPPNSVAVVDLTAMLALSRNGADDVCDAPDAPGGFLPASVVSFVAVP